MKTSQLKSILLGIGLACAGGLTALAQTTVPGTFKHITIDGSFADWTGVPLAYTAAVGAANAIQYENVYIANDQTNLYIRFTLYSPRAAFANSFDNIFIDADNATGTGYAVGGLGSEMLIQWGGGYQEKSGGFNEGGINNLGWNIAGSADSTDFELVISLGATYAADSTPVFSSSTLSLLLEGDNTSYANSEFVPTGGGFVYTLVSTPPPPTSDSTLISLNNTSWQVNASGTDLGTNWLDQAYDDTAAGWTAGTGLFGYTPSPASYPAIHTALAGGPSTYYFRTHFQWTNEVANVAFVVTNYLSDGAVYYLNGHEMRRIRLAEGGVAFGSAATGTNFPAGRADVFGLDASGLEPAAIGDNILEVETHQAPASSAEMVFGLSLKAATQFPALVVSTNLPANQSVFAGDAATFTSEVMGSGPLVYQWYFNGTNAIAGATASTYTIPFVLTNDVGTYSLQVSNSFSVATTRAASLTVSNIPVVITTEPVSQIALEGNPATLSVSATGTPVIRYQWLLGGNPIPGATNATYYLASSYGTNAGVYQVVVSNPASTTNSSLVNLTVLLNTIPPNIIAISTTPNQILVTFSKPVEAATAGNIANYSVTPGVTVLSATPNPGNPAQVTLTTGVGLDFGTVYTLKVNGVKDVFGNLAHVSGQFARAITIDGSFGDWSGITPVFSTDAPSAAVNAADFKEVYVYNDANNYYFRVTLWADLTAGHFPTFVNMFFDTDNDAGTGYSAIGSDMLIQSGYSYQQKDGGIGNGLVDGFGINGLNWLCLPQVPGTNFEFQISKTATFGEDGSMVFSTNGFKFLFQGMNPSFQVQDQAPNNGLIAYTNLITATVAPLPLGQVAMFPLPGRQVALVWDAPGILQQSPALTGAVWTNLPSATSPYVVPATDAQQFFRLTQ